MRTLGAHFRGLVGILTDTQTTNQAPIPKPFNQAAGVNAIDLLRIWVNPDPHRQVVTAITHFEHLRSQAFQEVLGLLRLKI
ncbi:hypothetical protein HMPREF9702_06232 [Delftia acidovorans CCUG 15835]|nr:hypothetical protein HMPREF9702_06232 [Delftia acidovorans CCUG 15835]